MTLTKKSTNNGQRRKAAKVVRTPLGKKVAYNENAPRSLIRRMLNTYTKCDKCGARMLAKHLDEHLRLALLHSARKK